MHVTYWNWYTAQVLKSNCMRPGMGLSLKMPKKLGCTSSLVLYHDRVVYLPFACQLPATLLLAYLHPASDLAKT